MPKSGMRDGKLIFSDSHSALKFNQDSNTLSPICWLAKAKYAVLDGLLPIRVYINPDGNPVSNGPRSPTTAFSRIRILPKNIGTASIPTDGQCSDSSLTPEH